MQVHKWRVFISSALWTYGIIPCRYGCGYIHLSSSTPGTRKKCCANGRLSSVSEEFDEELTVNYELELLPDFLRRILFTKMDFYTKIFNIQQFSGHGSNSGLQL
jgi:hypothetical protein